MHGPAHETLAPTGRTDPVDHYIQVLADKTGSLIAVSARYGAMLTGAGATTERIVEEFGEKIGVAFQLADDVIDLASDSETTGKTPGTDLREGVDTMPVLLLRKALAAGELDAAGQGESSRGCRPGTLPTTPCWPTSSPGCACTRCWPARGRWP